MRTLEATLTLARGRSLFTGGKIGLVSSVTGKHEAATANMPEATRSRVASPRRPTAWSQHDHGDAHGRTERAMSFVPDARRKAALRAKPRERAPEPA
jgi:hypothetical protein